MPAAGRLAPKDVAFWSALAVIALGDVLTKRAAEAVLSLHLPHDVLAPWMRLTLTYNPGAAMNLSLGASSRVVLSVIAVVMVALLYRMHRAAHSSDAWQSLALGLVAGGAIGNLIDRLRSARGVVDFIDVGTTGWRFWTFNVADAGVSVGAALLAIILWLRPEPAAASAASPATGPSGPARQP